MKTKSITRTGHKFLDPTETNSIVRYRFTGEEHKSSLSKKYHRNFEGTVYLTDCGDSISWDAYGSKGIKHLRKNLKNAIAMFNKALDDLNEIEEQYKEYRKSKD